MVVARLGAAAWRLLTDVRFAVVLIALLALAGLVGLLIRQFPVTAADDPVRYAAEVAATHGAWDELRPFDVPVGSALVEIFDALGLFSVFSTPWFLLLMTVLTISIVCCTLDRTPRLWRTAHDVRVAQPIAFFDPQRAQRAVLAVDPEQDPATVSAAVVSAFRARQFRRQRFGREGQVTYVYGDRNQYQKMATLLTHAGLVLFLVGGATTVAAGFETVVFVGEGQTAPVRPIGTPGNLLVKNHDFASPRRADGSFADFSTDLSVFRDGQEVARKIDPRQRPADGGRLRLPPEHVRAGRRPHHPRRLGRAGLGRTTPPRRPAARPSTGLHDHPRRGRRASWPCSSQGADGAAQLVMQGIGPADPVSGESQTLFLVTIPQGVTTDPEVTAGHSIAWTGTGAWTGMVVKSDPGQSIVWLAFGFLIAGIVLTFYFPRRRAWARIEAGEVRPDLPGRPIRGCRTGVPPARRGGRGRGHRRSGSAHLKSFGERNRGATHPEAPAP